MFKSKKSLFILLPLTIGIWGYIAWKIYIGINPSLPEVQELDASRFRESVQNQEVLESLESPTYDPFTGKNSKVKNIERSTTPVRKPSIEKKWPKIGFQGIVKNPKTKKAAAALFINGSTRVVSVGEVVDSIKLVSIRNQTIHLQYGGQIKEIQLKNNNEL